MSLDKRLEYSDKNLSKLTHEEQKAKLDADTEAFFANGGETEEVEREVIPGLTDRVRTIAGAEGAEM